MITLDKDLVQTNLTIPLRMFIKQQYGNQKKASRIFNISQPLLTMIMNGKRKPSVFMLKQLESDGFDIDKFASLYNITIPEQIDDYEDFRFIVSQLRALLLGKDRLINAYEMMNRNLQTEVADLKKKVTNLQAR